MGVFCRGVCGILGCVVMGSGVFMSACGAVIVMSSAYVVSCTESGGSGMSEV